MSIVGIDAGTRWTHVFWNNGQKSGELRIPTCLFVLQTGFLYGFEALERYEGAATLPDGNGDADMACFFDSFASELSSNAPHGLPDGRSYTNQALMTHFLRMIRENNDCGSTICLTHPPEWTEIAKDHLLDATKNAGFTVFERLDSPVAAVYASSFVHLPTGNTVMVLDAGDAGFHAHLVRHTAGSGWQVPFHGQKSTFSGYEATMKLYELAEKRLKIPVNDILDPCLLHACRDALEKLSKSDTAMIFNARVTCDELEAILQNQLLDAVQTAKTLLAQAEECSMAPEHILLAGGMAHLPFVQRAFRSAFGVRLAVAAQTDMLFAKGATNYLEQHQKEQKTTSKTISELDGVTLTVETSPEDAEITLDGKHIGNTPVTVPIKAGKHIVTIKKFGFHDEKHEIVTNEWENYTHFVDLHPFIGLYVTSEPSNAAVYVNKQRIEDKATPCYVELEPGDYFVEVEPELFAYPRTGKRVRYEGGEIGIYHIEVQLDNDKESVNRRMRDREIQAKRARIMEETRIKELEAQQKTQQDEQRKKILAEKQARIRQKELERQRAGEAAEQTEIAKAKLMNDLWIEAEKERKATNYSKAVDLYKRIIAESECAYTMHRLGECYWNGWGCAPDSKQAIMLFTEAAKKGVEGSNLNLACIAFLEKRDAEGRSYLLKATQGYTKSSHTYDKAKEYLDICEGNFIGEKITMGENWGDGELIGFGLLKTVQGVALLTVRKKMVKQMQQDLQTPMEIVLE